MPDFERSPIEVVDLSLLEFCQDVLVYLGVRSCTPSRCFALRLTVLLQAHLDSPVLLSLLMPGIAFMLRNTRSDGFDRFPELRDASFVIYGYAISHQALRASPLASIFDLLRLTFPFSCRAGAALARSARRACRAESVRDASSRSSKLLPVTSSSFDLVDPPFLTERCQKLPEVALLLTILLADPLTNPSSHTQCRLPPAQYRIAISHLRHVHYRSLQRLLFLPPPFPLFPHRGVVSHQRHLARACLRDARVGDLASLGDRVELRRAGLSRRGIPSGGEQHRPTAPLARRDAAAGVPATSVVRDPLPFFFSSRLTFVLAVACSDVETCYAIFDDLWQLPRASLTGTCELFFLSFRLAS